MVTAASLRRPEKSAACGPYSLLSAVPGGILRIRATLLAATILFSLATAATCITHRNTTDVPLRDCLQRDQCPMGTVLDTRDGKCAYHVGLIFPYGEFPSKASSVLGAYLAIEHINTRNATVVPDAALLPLGFKIVPILLDSHSSPADGVSAGLDALKAGVIAVVGAGRSSASIPLSHVMAATHTPVVSYASTSAMLSSSDTFPYFARTIPTDTDVSSALAHALLKEFNWRRVGMLYVDDHGLSISGDFNSACREVANSMGLTAQDYEIRSEAVDSNIIEASMLRMRDSGFRVFALALLDGMVPAFLRAAEKLGMIGKGYTYITLDSGIAEVVKRPLTYGLEPAEADTFNKHLQGMLWLNLDPLVEPQYSALHDAAVEHGSTIVPREFKSALESQGADLDDWFKQGLRRDIHAVYAYDAVWSIALALGEAEQKVPRWLKEDCGMLIHCHGKELIQLIRSSSFQGGSGSVQFKASGSELQGSTFLGDRDASIMEHPLQFYNSTSREWVTSGRLEHGRLELTRSVVWPGQPPEFEGPPSDGTSCEAGSFFDDVTLSCAKCSPGWFSFSKGQAECQPCKPGTYCAMEGCEVCNTCDVNTYQIGSAATSCDLCPANTLTNGRGMWSRESCLCRPGSYRRDGKFGESCFDCPEGAVCQGGSHAPYADQGYWGDWALVDLSEADSDEAAIAIHGTSFRMCLNPAYCTSNFTVDDIANYEAASSLMEGQDNSITSEASSELLRIVRSDSSRLCSVEARGRMCAFCSLGHYSLGGKCLPCMKPYALFVVGCFLAIIAVWYLINRFAASRYEAVDLMLLYFQNASTLSTYSLNWNQWLVAGPFWLLSIVNFDVDFFKPDCLSTSSFSAWSFGHSLVLQMLLPVLVILACIARYYLGRAAVAFVEHARLQLPVYNPDKAGSGSYPLRLDAANANEVLSPPLYIRALRCVGIPIAAAELTVAYDNGISTSTSFCMVVYHTLTLKCLEVFITKGLPDGTRFVVADPSLSNTSDQYKIYVFFSIVGLLVYTVGFPLYCFFMLEYGRVHNLFREDRFRSRYGWLYLRYERDWYYWELVILARRAGLVLVTLATAVPSLQIWFGLTVIVATMTVHFYARPFIDDSLDLLETTSLVGLIGLMMTGILFYDTEGPKQFENWGQVVSILVCFFLFGALALVTTMVINDIRREEISKRVARRLRQDIQQILNVHAPVEKTDNGMRQNTFRAHLWGSVKGLGRKSFDFLGRKSFSRPGSQRGLLGRKSLDDSGRMPPPRTIRRRSAPALSTLSTGKALGEAVQPLHVNPKAEGNERQPLHAKPVEAEGQVRKALHVERAEEEGGEKLPMAVKQWVRGSARDLMKWRVNSARVIEEDLELHKTLDVHTIEKWLNSKRAVGFSHKGKCKAKVLPTPADPNAAYLPEGGTTLTPEQQKDVVHLWLVNHWMKEIMSDTSPVSYFSRGIHSQFFGDLVTENPYLIDCLMHLPKDKLDRARETLKDLRKAQLLHTKNGRLAPLITPIDRGAMLAWLMVAPHHNISVLRSLMQELSGTPVPETRQRERSRSLFTSSDGDTSSRFSSNLLLDSIIYKVMPDPTKLGIERRPTVEASGFAAEVFLKELNGGRQKDKLQQNLDNITAAAAFPDAPGKRRPLKRSTMSSISLNNPHLSTNEHTMASIQTLNLITCVDGQIKKLGHFSSEIAKFLENLEVKISRQVLGGEANSSVTSDTSGHYSSRSSPSTSPSRSYSFTASRRGARTPLREGTDGFPEATTDTTSNVGLKDPGQGGGPPLTSETHMSRGLVKATPPARTISRLAEHGAASSNLAPPIGPLPLYPVMPRRSAYDLPSLKDGSVLDLSLVHHDEGDDGN